MKDSHQSSCTLQNPKLGLFKGDEWLGVVLICFLLVEAEWRGEGTKEQTRGERSPVHPLLSSCTLGWGREAPLMHRFFCWVLIHSPFSSRVCNGQVLTPRPLPLQTVARGKEMLICCCCDLLTTQTASLCWHHSCRAQDVKAELYSGCFSLQL